MRVMQGVSQLFSHISKRHLSSSLTHHASNASKFLRFPVLPFAQARLVSTSGSGFVKGLSDKLIDNRAQTPTPQERWAIKSRKALENAIANPPADAYAGRSIKVMGNENGLAAALKSLNDVLMRNRVRQQVRSSERHEKKGVKRRRLQSERWRKQFANEVRKKVQLVMKIRDRGA